MLGKREWLLLGGNLTMDWHPIRGKEGEGGRNIISSRFMLLRPELSAGLMGHFARKQTLPCMLSNLSDSVNLNSCL